MPYKRVDSIMMGGFYTLSSLSTVLLVLAIFIAVFRFYKHRRRFAELSGVEWAKYIFGFILALVVAATVILGGMFILKFYLSGWLYFISRIVLIILGLSLGSTIFLKFIPSSLKTFYKT